MTNILFVNMPFAPPDRPSIAIGILQALLASVGRSSKAHYFNLDFYEAIDLGLVREITGGVSKPQDLLGEWVFASQVNTIDDENYAIKVLTGNCETGAECSTLLATARHARACVPDFIDRCVETLLQEDPALICFTTVFQQNMASLALAKRIKARSPRTKILFGGANCHGASGPTLLANYEFIDAVCTAEAEEGFFDVVESLITDRPVISPNYLGRITSATVCRDNVTPIGNKASFTNLNDVPVPCYDDFFSRWQSFARASEFGSPSILIETSRGCWWGQKMHCTFCGLNGTGMAFRQKTAERALDEMEELLGRYGNTTRNLYAVDNIMPKSYEREVILTSNRGWVTSICSMRLKRIFLTRRLSRSRKMDYVISSPV